MKDDTINICYIGNIKNAIVYFKLTKSILGLPMKANG